MSRPLHKYTIVHCVSIGQTRGCDAESVEEVDTVWAATADQAVEAYCLANNVHRASAEAFHEGVQNEWYEAEEVDE